MDMPGTVLSVHCSNIYMPGTVLSVHKHGLNLENNSK